jgi:hypothetical protein
MGRRSLHRAKYGRRLTRFDNGRKGRSAALSRISEPHSYAPPGPLPVSPSRATALPTFDGVGTCARSAVSPSSDAHVNWNDTLPKWRSCRSLHNGPELSGQRRLGSGVSGCVMEGVRRVLVRVALTVSRQIEPSGRSDAAPPCKRCQEFDLFGLQSATLSRRRLDRRILSDQ